MDSKTFDREFAKALAQSLAKTEGRNIRHTFTHEDLPELDDCYEIVVITERRLTDKGFMEALEKSVTFSG